MVKPTLHIISLVAHIVAVWRKCDVWSKIFSCEMLERRRFVKHLQRHVAKGASMSRVTASIGRLSWHKLLKRNHGKTQSDCFNRLLSTEVRKAVYRCLLYSSFRRFLFCAK